MSQMFWKLLCSSKKISEKKKRYLYLQQKRSIQTKNKKGVFIRRNEKKNVISHLVSGNVELSIFFDITEKN